MSQLVNAYRVRGHLFARVDPLRLEAAAPPELELANFGLAEADLDRTFPTVDMAGPKTATLREIIARLDETYCRSIGVEFTHIEEPESAQWLQERMESTQNRARARPRRAASHPHASSPTPRSSSSSSTRTTSAPSASRSRAPRA